MISDLATESLHETAEQQAARKLNPEQAEAVIQQYSKLVHKLAWQMAPDENLREDLVQEGFRALLVAAGNRDEAQGLSFAGYAQQYIHGAMWRFRQDWRWQVRLPQNRTDIFLSSVYLDAPCEFEDHAARSSLLESFFEESIQPDAGLGFDECEQVALALKQLNKRDEELVRRYFWGGESYNDIGKSWGCTRQNVALYMASALRSLRWVLTRKEVTA